MEIKGQGRTFWIVVIAIVALAVMVVLLVMFTSKTGALETGLMDCQSKRGTCTAPVGGDCEKTCKDAGMSNSRIFSCYEKTKCCCLGIEKKK